MTRPSLIAALVAAALAAPPAVAHARTLAEVQARGTISMCANPDALPYASKAPERPGFQIEIGRAVAQALGVSLTPEWIVPRHRASLVNCDMLMDSINDPHVHEGSLLLSRPYQRSGIALALRPGAEAVNGLSDLRKGQKIGVMVNSVASVVFGKRGLTTSPYAFEPDMMRDVANGELFGAAISHAAAAWYLHENPGSRVRLVHAYDAEPQLAWTVCIGLRKADQALLDRVNAAVESLLADGTIARIYARYGVDHRTP